MVGNPAAFDDGVFLDEKQKIHTDLELLSLAQKGDVNATDEIIIKYKPLILSECRDKFLPGADFEDLVQEGFIGILSAIKTFDPTVGIAFPGFAELCVKRRIANALKNANREKHSPLNSYVSFSEMSSDEDKDRTVCEDEIPEDLIGQELLSPEDILIKREDEENLNDKLSKALTPLEFTVLLSLVDGFSYAETATRLGVTEKSVDNARQRIKAKLTKKILLEN